MGKFEYGLAGVMAFLILGILGMIALSPNSESIELKETMTGLGSTSEPKQSTVFLGGQPIEPEPEVTIGESLEVEIKESEAEPEVMEEAEPEVMEEAEPEVMEEAEPEVMEEAEPEVMEEAEPEVMEEAEPEVMEEPKVHTHEVIIPEGTGVPGCEENNECYIPYSISMKVGHSVTWINEDTAAHTVTSGTADGGPDGLFDSSLFLSGATYEYTFEETGTFDYFCMVHPWMTGIIKVVD